MTKETEVLQRFSQANQDPKPGDPKPGDPKPKENTPEPGDPKPGDPKPGEAQLPELNDESVFKYLSEKQGTPITSMDDLFKEKEVEKIVERPITYASEKVGAIDKYVLETGRDPEDYFKIHKDWTEVNDDVVAREYLKSQRPGLSDEDVGDLITIKYKPDEKKDDDGNVLNAQEVRLAGLEYKDIIGSGRQFFETEKSKYSIPVEAKQSAESWKNEVGALLNNEKIEVQVGEYKHVLTDKAQLSRRYESMDSVLKDKAFVTEGKFDPAKFMSVMEKGLNAEAIVKNALTNAETKIREEILGEFPEPGNKPGERQAKPGDPQPGLKPEQKNSLLGMHERIAR